MRAADSLPYKIWKRSGLFVGADDLGGPRATARVAPTVFCGKVGRRVREAAPYNRVPPERAGEGTRPYGALYFVGAGHWPARIRGAPRSSRPTQKSVLSLPPHPPQRAHWGTFPCRGRLWACSNREEFGALWDVWIHILEIGAECACWGAGGLRPPLRRITEHFEKRREGKPLPYGFPEMTLELGRGAPWVSRRGIRIRPAGGPVCRPYGVRGTSMAGG